MEAGSRSWRASPGAAVLLAVVAIAGLFEPVAGPGSPRFAVAGLLLASAIGLGVGLPWSRTAGLVGLVLLDGLILVQLVASGVTLVGSIALLATLAVVGVLILVWPRRLEVTEVTASLVGLLARPARLESTIVAAAASQAWELDVGTEEDENERAYVVGESPHFLLKREDWLFALHDVDEPYFDDAERVTAYTADVRIRRAVESHRAWLSIDVLYAPHDATECEAFAIIGPLLLELVRDDLVGVERPDTGAIYPRLPELERALGDDDPAAALEALVAPPVLTIREDDPRMQAAVETARDRWGEFVLAFESRTADEGFSVKAPVSDGDTTEFLWLNVTAIENDVVYGTLGNDPIALRDHRRHDHTKVPVGDLNDWLYLEDGELRGGFTLDVFRRVADEPADPAE